MTTISAQLIAHSQHATTGQTIATLLLRYPRCIHPELMTHRLFSRNAASSRAIPVAKMIQSVIDDPFVPLYRGKNQKGMQAGEECNAPILIGGARFTAHSREDAWLHARDYAVSVAEDFAAAGYHKQIVNRLLEPFMHITTLVTSTQWSNWFALRDHPDAEPHIQHLAREMRHALDESEPTVLEPGRWHLPFISAEDKQQVIGEGWDDSEETRRASTSVPAHEWYGLGKLLSLSVARCASTSYKTVDGFDMTLDRADEIHDKLVASVPMHASPLEHQAMADYTHGSGLVRGYASPKQHGNFTGFVQYRKTLPGECQ